RDDTRFNTPGLFSTYATSVCMFSSPSHLLFVGAGLAPPADGSFLEQSDLQFLRRRLNQRAVRAAHPFVKRSACPAPPVHRVFLLNAEVDQEGFLALARGTNRRNHISA